jgi:ribonuclease HI
MSMIVQVRHERQELDAGGWRLEARSESTGMPACASILQPPASSLQPGAIRVTPDIVSWTDGGCRGNPGPGGWGMVLVNAASRDCLERCGGERTTTNNRMEITAAIMVLRSLKKPDLSVVIHSDSQLLIKGATEWMRGWKARGWRRKEGELLNAELWQELDRLMEVHRTTWKWVKGHAGDPGNERADQLTNRAMDAVQAGQDADWTNRTTWTGRLG